MSYSSEFIDAAWYGVGTYVSVVGAWTCAVLFFAAVRHAGMWEKYRIQPRPGAADTPALRRTAAGMVAFNWAWLLPATLAGGPVLRELFPASAAPPPAWQAPFIVLLWFVLHDLGFYTYHRILHEVPWLYNRVHKRHHLFTAPFAWMSTALHPAEMLLQTVGAMSGPLLWAGTCGLPVTVLWAWLALIMVQGVFDHCGYDLPWDPFSLLPGAGGAPFHDDHHKMFTVNYAAVFSVIDDTFGTSRRCKERRLQQKAAATAAARRQPSAAQPRSP